MNGGSTIGVPITATAFSDFPKSAGAEAQATGERGRRDAASTRGRGRRRIVFEGALVDRAGIDAREALRAWPRHERGRLVGRAGKAEGREREAAALGLDGGCGDGARVGLGACLLAREAVASAEQVLERLGADRGTAAVRGTWRRKRRRLFVGHCGDCVCCCDCGLCGSGGGRV